MTISSKLPARLQNRFRGIAVVPTCYFANWIARSSTIFIRSASAKQPLQSFDSLKGVFLVEGGQRYEGSGFYNKTHIQICICNPSCIKGVFGVPDEHLSGL
jgi:hypothetical protein